MPVSLEFDTTHQYIDAKDGINVPVTLVIGPNAVELLAKLDTGAANCVFERRYAEMLELDVESGRLQRFRTVTGSFAAYEHEINDSDTWHRVCGSRLFCSRFGLQQKLSWPIRMA